MNEIYSLLFSNGNELPIPLAYRYAICNPDVTPVSYRTDLGFLHPLPPDFSPPHDPSHLLGTKPHDHQTCLVCLTTSRNSTIRAHARVGIHLRKIQGILYERRGQKPSLRHVKNLPSVSRTTTVQHGPNNLHDRAEPRQERGRPPHER